MDGPNTTKVTASGIGSFVRYVRVLTLLSAGTWARICQNDAHKKKRDFFVATGHTIHTIYCR